MATGKNILYFDFASIEDIAFNDYNIKYYISRHFPISRLIFSQYSFFKRFYVRRILYGYCSNDVIIQKKLYIVDTGDDVCASVLERINREI